MRLVLGNLFRHSPLENTLRHAEAVARCGPIFVNAVKSYFENDRNKFELLKEDIREIENEADRMKRNVRAHLPSSLLLPFDKSVFFTFLREADKVVDSIKNALYWMSYYNLEIPEETQKDFILLAKEVADYIGFLPEMVKRAHTYFTNRMEKDREAVKEVIREIRFREGESDDLEKTLLIRLCADQELPAKTFFVMIRLVETTGDIADHLENSADMMRIMIAR
jgi:predicted phosphate transport protein (TIGR00153 family)